MVAGVQGTDTAVCRRAEAHQRDTLVELGDVTGHSAAWSRDGRQLVYANGTDLYLANHDGSAPRKLLSLPNEAQGLTFSPDGGRIRFTLGVSFTVNIPVGSPCRCHRVECFTSRLE